MGRGLDGYLSTLQPCAVFKLHRGGVSPNFRWRIAKGKHLFPFRTEQLSLSAPMVLGGQPPGRVGRRRFFFKQVRDRVSRGLRRTISGALRHRRAACVALLRGATRRRRIACSPNASGSRLCAARTSQSLLLGDSAGGAPREPSLNVALRLALPTLSTPGCGGSRLRAAALCRRRAPAGPAACLGAQEEGAIGFPPPQVGPRGGGGGAAAGFAARGRSPNGL
jgi:hypothetical protein